MTKQHPENNQDLLSNSRCYLAPKKNWRKIAFDANSFDIFANYSDSYCATPDEVDFFLDTYKHLTGVKINGIDEGLKVAGLGSVCWIFQDDKRDNI